jgi:hypothetical protein
MEALTGPIERGDVDTVKMHVDVLQKFAPHLTTFYLILGVETARLALIKGSLSSEQFNSLINFARQTVTKNKKEKK